MRINAKCFVPYWQCKGDNVITIYPKLVTRFCEKALAYSSVANWLRRLYFGDDIFESGIHPEKSSDGLVDFNILASSLPFPFHSMPTFACILKIPRSTTWDHLRKGPSVAKHLRWVSHRLDDVTKKVCVTMAESLLKNLRQVRHQGWQYFLTGNESQFLCYGPEQMWLPQGVKP
jgi:hypothetical protein